MVSTTKHLLLLYVTESKEYCHLDRFNASCAANEVILMKLAQYGRMRLGKCLNRDYFVGCSLDVLRKLDLRCSGRSSCDMPMPDPELFQLQPCPKDLTVYLEAEYTCIKGR